MTQDDYRTLQSERPELRLPDLSFFTHHELALLRTISTEQIISAMAGIAVTGEGRGEKNRQFFGALRELGDFKAAYAADGVQL